MPSYSPKDVQDELLKVIRTSQETVVEAVKTWVETVKAVTPKVPSSRVPLAAKLPKPQDIVTNAYDFAEKLLSSQRQFAEELVEATAPLRAGSGMREEQSAATE
ncbi:hypothetical protein EAS64_24550 [Trebonia kvetii]|uniref:Uncharacterized protein n=1 Tax=Trebonia kvetii TaxID=2480626 RepID=A0A6P2BXW8_9ACTN|nr:hypothetical protein [Trebonia kvetii]TVZ03547.1 hypothetical protein EAS64_24550 [Trebonia kvetii]